MMNYIKLLSVFLCISSALQAMEPEAPLVQAAKTGNIETVKQLLDAGADINQPDGHGRTPLMKAAAELHVATVKLLLERGADIDCKDSLGKTAWAHANEWIFPHRKDENNRIATLQLFCERGIDINQRISQDNTTALMNAIWASSYEATGYEAMLFLLKHGALVALEDNHKQTALKYATKIRNIDLCMSCSEALVEHMLMIPNQELIQRLVAFIICAKKNKFNKDLSILLAKYIKKASLQAHPELSIAFDEVKKLKNSEIKTYLWKKYMPDAKIFPAIPKSKKKKRRTDE